MKNLRLVCMTWISSGLTHGLPALEDSRQFWFLVIWNRNFSLLGSSDGVGTGAHPGIDLCCLDPQFTRESEISL